MERSCPDAAAMEALGAALARVATLPFVVLLQGELGAGKTTLARGWLRALGIAGAIKSPTFTLVEPYLIPGPAGASAFHFDLYRVGDPEELELAGLRDYLAQDALCLIEWPERVRGMQLPADLRIEIEVGAAGEGRQVRLQALSNAGQMALQRLAVPA